VAEILEPLEEPADAQTHTITVQYRAVSNEKLQHYFKVLLLSPLLVNLAELSASFSLTLCIVFRVSHIVFRASFFAHRFSHIVFRASFFAHRFSRIVFRASFFAHRFFSHVVFGTHRFSGVFSSFLHTRRRNEKENAGELWWQDFTYCFLLLSPIDFFLKKSN
jgi:hypothetical protein